MVAQDINEIQTGGVEFLNKQKEGIAKIDQYLRGNEQDYLKAAEATRNAAIEAEKAAEAEFAAAKAYGQKIEQLHAIADAFLAVAESYEKMIGENAKRSQAVEDQLWSFDPHIETLTHLQNLINRQVATN